MRLVGSLLIVALLNSVTFAQNFEAKCGVAETGHEGFAQNWSSYIGLEHEQFISLGEALIWEYSDDPICWSDEYQITLKQRLENASKPLGKLIRNPGIIDSCHYRKIVSGNESPYEFHSGLNRRLFTLRTDSQFYTILATQQGKAIKFDHNNNDVKECLNRDFP